MRLSPEIAQRGVGRRARPPLDRAAGELAGLQRIPLLRGGGRGQPQREQCERQPTRPREAARWLTVASAAALAMACGGDGSGPNNSMTRAELLALARVDSAEPSPATFVFKNNQVRTFHISHSDSTQTVFATFMFTPGSIVSRNDTLLADSSTIAVSVSIALGSYEFTVGPAALVFNQTGEPVVSVSYGRYEDPSVYTMSPRYASAAAFTQALGLWHERAPDRWVLGRNSSHTDPSTVTSAIEGPGTYLLAAPK